MRLDSIAVPAGSLLARHQNFVLLLVVLGAYAAAIPPDQTLSSTDLEHVKDLLAFTFAFFGLTFRCIAPRIRLNWVANLLILFGIFLMHGDLYVVVFGLLTCLTMHYLVSYAREGGRKEVSQQSPRTLLPRGPSSIRLGFREAIAKEWLTVTVTFGLLLLTEVYEEMHEQAAASLQFTLLLLSGTLMLFIAAALGVQLWRKQKVARTIAYGGPSTRGIQVDSRIRSVDILETEAASRFKRGNPLSCIRHIPGQPLTYLQNHKAASNSIELALWRAHDPEGVPLNPHVPGMPFIRNVRRARETDIQSLLASEFFSVVRNPYSRLLAGYLDKVKVGKPSWTRISVSVGLSPDFHPSLAEFLSALQSSDPHQVEKHFRPQHLVLLHGLAPLDFLAHMERMDRLSVFLQGHGVVLQRYDRHATHAAARVREIIGPHEAKIIARYYESDFQIYGYSENPAELFPLERPLPTHTDRMPLRRFIEQMTTKMPDRSNRPFGQALPERDTE